MPKSLPAHVVGILSALDRRKTGLCALADGGLARFGQVLKDFVCREAGKPRLTEFFLLHAPHRGTHHFADVGITAGLHLAADEFRHLGRNRNVHLFHSHMEGLLLLLSLHGRVTGCALKAWDSLTWAVRLYS